MRPEWPNPYLGEIKEGISVAKLRVRVNYRGDKPVVRADSWLERKCILVQRKGLY